MDNQTVINTTGKPVTEQAPAVDTTSTTQATPVTAFGFRYSSISRFSKAWRIPQSTIRTRFKEGFDIEVAIITRDRLVLRHIGLDGKAYYKAKWAPDLVTARQIVEHYRPDLLDAYDKNNPTGKWNPVLRENTDKQEEN